MKKLTLIQNDTPGTGKATVTRCLARYLDGRGANFQALVFCENPSDAVAPQVWLNPDELNRTLVGLLDGGPDITLLEIGTGFGDTFGKYYAQHELADFLHELGIDVTVVVPVTRDEESFEAVVLAAETYSDGASYVVFHIEPGKDDAAYSDEDPWERSYAARVMDMFDAVERGIPAAGDELERAFRKAGTNLADTLLEVDPAAAYGASYLKWLQIVEHEIHAARQNLFGDAARDFSPPGKGRRAVAAK